MDLHYDTLEQLLEAARQADCRLSSLVLEQQAKEMESTPGLLYSRMEHQYDVMTQAVQKGLTSGVRSNSGLTGGDANKLAIQIESQKHLCGDLITGALARAMAVAEINAAMGCIVAAPTAGSCGILPSAVITMQTEKNISKKDCVMSLFTASAVGMVIARNACLSGAQGGCQAECGSASAMAAAAIVELSGGTPDMIGHAVAIAIKNTLGLVCDPVAGLVEIPCIKRNASGVANAFVAAELALSEIRSAIPADETIIAMKSVGDSMAASLKETGEGGLAGTPTGQRIFRQLFGADVVIIDAAEEIEVSNGTVND